MLDSYRVRRNLLQRERRHRHSKEPGRARRPDNRPHRRKDPAYKAYQAGWYRRYHQSVSAAAARFYEKKKQIPGPRNGEAWTPEEDEIAMDPRLTVTEKCTEKCYLLGRSYAAVQGRRQLLREGRFLGTQRPWTPQEDAYIMRDDISLTEMSITLGRSYGSIHARRGRLRRLAGQPPRESCNVRAIQRREGNASAWSPEQDELVMRDDLTIDQIAELTGHSYNAVVCRRHVLRRQQGAPILARPWTPDDDALVMRDDIPLRLIAEMLGRTYEAAAARRHRLRRHHGERRQKSGARNPWTPAQDAVVMRSDLTITEMVALTGHSYNAVVCRRQDLRRQAA
jgi:hypothetical protein